MDRIEDVDPRKGCLSDEAGDEQPVIQRLEQLGKEVVQDLRKAEFQQSAEGKILSDLIDVFRFHVKF